jgi:hypothetical protein
MREGGITAIWKLDGDIFEIKKLFSLQAATQQ